MALPANVVFDVGNVLLRWDPLRLVREAVPDPGLHQRVLVEMFQHEDWKHLDQGTLDETEAERRFSARLGLPLPDTRRLLQASKETLCPMPEGLDLLRDVTAAGARVWCLTNMSHGTWAFLRRRYDFWGLFAGIVVSAEIRLIKPDPAIFRHLLARFALAAEATAFLDDNAANVAGARAAGIRARVFGPDSREWLWSGAPQ